MFLPFGCHFFANFYLLHKAITRTSLQSFQNRHDIPVQRALLHKCCYGCNAFTIRKLNAKTQRRKATQRILLRAKLVAFCKETRLFQNEGGNSAYKHASPFVLKGPHLFAVHLLRKKIFALLCALAPLRLIL